MYGYTYTWRAGPTGPILRRIPIYRVTTLPNSKEVERLLVCEINGTSKGLISQDDAQTNVYTPKNSWARRRHIGRREPHFK